MAKHEPMKTSKTVELTNPQGLHARPSTKFVLLANRFESDILVEFRGQSVNGKSVIELMTLGAEVGSSLVLTATGKDSEKALTELAELVASGFGET